MACSWLVGALLGCSLHASLPVTDVPTSGEISGKATVQDGDTIYVGHTAVRLEGVDAEELNESHGVRAKLALKAIVGDGTVVCRLNGNSYRRSVARCFVGDVELNRSIVASGWALDCARYSAGRYRDAEPDGARRRLLQKPYCKP
jgi:micrococcal nuclease